MNDFIFLAQSDAGGGIGALFGLMCFVGLIAIAIIPTWVVFTKAGQPGWAAIIPIYNTIVLLEIVGRPLWFIVLFFIPFLNFVAAVLLAFDLAKSFGKDEVYGCGILLLPWVFLFLLAFGDARYVGPAAAN